MAAAMSDYVESRSKDHRVFIFTSSKQGRIRKFHVVVVQRRQRNLPKSVLRMKNLLFNFLKLSAFLLLQFIDFKARSMYKFFDVPLRSCESSNAMSQKIKGLTKIFSVTASKETRPFAAHCKKDMLE